MPSHRDTGARIRHCGAVPTTPLHRQTTAAITAVVLLSTLILAFNSTPARAQISAPKVATAPTLMYPLPPRSTSAQLPWRHRKKLPKVARWATAIIGSQLDQPTGLTDVQVVSAFHIRKVFRKKLGQEAFHSAIRIAWRESRLLPHVVNDKNTNQTNDWGLFQLNDGGTMQYAGLLPEVRSLRPRRNAKAARALVQSTGWGPWGGMLCVDSIPCAPPTPVAPPAPVG